jgi:predicted signal transduction protein with EAL and GGDEF domain
VVAPPRTQSSTQLLDVPADGSTELDIEAADVEIELDRLLAAGGVRSVYQPIVELYTGATVGYEALARATTRRCGICPCAERSWTATVAAGRFARSAWCSTSRRRRPWRSRCSG